MWPRQVAYRFYSERGALAERNGHDKESEKSSFDSKVFLATVNGGRSISKYRMNQTVFSQVVLRMRSSISKKARSKSPLSQSRARKPSSQYWGRMSSAERDA